MSNSQSDRGPRKAGLPPLFGLLVSVVIIGAMTALWVLVLR
jgi:hypothetical protein